MVNRKRSSSASNAEEQPENANGMTVNGVSVVKEVNKRTNVNTRENPLSPLNTRSKVQTSIGAEVPECIVSIKDNGSDECDEKIAKEKGAGPALRTSARTQKRARRDPSPPPPPRKIAKPIEVQEQVRTRRTWEMWSSEDKKAFFEALCEYGKDFESIQHYLAQKNKKKNHPPQMTRNKDQVRHFYYRTWHKISKYLHLADDIKKQTQELYGLINYGELRKKIGLEKSGHKLNELVHTGATTIRFKGKNLRLKTPVCRALKKLNNVVECKEDEQIKLPPKITVEFRPLNNESWTRVQSVAQNPRVKVTVSLQRRLSSIIEYLQRKWRQPHVKHKEQLHADLGEPLASTETGEVLRVMPQKDAKITLVSMEASSEMITCASVSLNGYRANVLDKMLPAKKKSRKRKAKVSVSAPGDDKDVRSTPSAEEMSGPTAVDSKSKLTASKPLDKTNSCDLPVSENVVAANEITSNTEREQGHRQRKRVELHPVSVAVEESNSLPAHEVALRQLLALEDATATPKSNVDAFFKKLQSELRASESSEQTNVELGIKPETKHLPEVPSITQEEEMMLSPTLPSEREKPEEHADEQMERVRHGWTAAEAGTMVIGELFLKMGSPSNMILEYCWETSPVKNTVPEQFSAVPEQKSKPIDQLVLHQLLGKLLRVASTTFSDLKKQEKPNVGVSSPCRCGHTCGSSASSASRSTNARSPATSRTATKIHKTIVSKQPASTESETAPTSPVVSSHCTNVANSGGVFLVPSMAAPQSRSQANKSITTVQQQSKMLASDTAFKEQLDKLLPSHRKARGRSRKSVVVQRELPLLPKKTSPHSMMTLRFVQSASQLGSSFVPVMSNVTLPTAVAIPTNAAAIAKVVKLSPTKLLGTSTMTLQPATVTSVLASSGMTTVTGTIASSHRPMLGPTRIVERCLGGVQNVSCISTRGSFTVTPVTAASSSSSKVTLKTTHLPTIQPPVLLPCPPAPSTQTLTIKTVAQPPCSTSSAVIGKATLTSSMLELSIPETSASATSSPLSISSLLDISLPGCDTLQADSGPSSLASSDKLLDLTLGNSNSGFSVFNMVTTASEAKTTNTGTLRSPTLSSEPLLEISQATPSFSPNNSPFKVSSLNLENAWINGESVDISLSSLLGNLESPVKQHPTTTATLQMQETTSTMDPIGRLSNDVDTQLQCMLNENSIDYVAKFADLAAQIATVPSLETPKKPSSPH